MSELYLVRHAQASFGGDHYDQLSDLGYRQARWLGAYFRQRCIGFDKLVLGDMQRHRQTLQAVCSGMQMDGSGSLLLPGLNEYNFTELVAAYGKSYADDPLYKRIVADPLDKKNYYRLLRQVLTVWAKDEIPGVVESWIAFKARVSDAQRQIQTMAESGDRILAIGSGGSISTFVGLVLAIADENIFDLNLQYKNTAISHFFFNANKINLTGFNSIPHLDSNEMERYITYG